MASGRWTFRSGKREEYERNEKKAFVLAETIGQSIMDKAGGGRNLNTSIKKWNFDKLNKNFTIEVEVNWDGRYFEENHYNVEGVILYKLGESDYIFSKTNANDNYLSLEFIFAGSRLLDSISNEINGE